MGGDPGACAGASAGPRARAPVSRRGPVSLRDAGGALRHPGLEDPPASRGVQRGRGPARRRHARSCHPQHVASAGVPGCVLGHDGVRPAAHGSLLPHRRTEPPEAPQNGRGLDRRVVPAAGCHGPRRLESQERARRGGGPDLHRPRVCAFRGSELRRGLHAQPPDPEGVPAARPLAAVLRARPRHLCLDPGHAAARGARLVRGRKRAASGIPDAGPRGRKVPCRIPGCRVRARARPLSGAAPDRERAARAGGGLGRGGRIAAPPQP